MAQEPPPQWVIDLNSPPRPKAKNTNITNPPGYTEASTGKVHPIAPIPSPRYSSITAFVAYRYLIQKCNPKTTHHSRNRHPEAEKVMGTRPRACQSLAHERNHDVHVRQFAADIQHNDGLHVVQEPYHRHLHNERSFQALRIRGDEEAAVGCQGMLCVDELCGAGIGRLEGQWYGSTTDYEERLAGLGDGEAAVGEGHFCLQVTA